MVWIEDIVGPHYCHEVLGFAQVDYVVCVTREHMYGQDPVSADFELDRLVWLADLEVDTDLALLDQSMTADYYEELPLAVKSALAFLYLALSCLQKTAHGLWS